MIRVLLVDDHDLFREGLRELLQSQAEIEIVGEVSDGLQVERAVEETRPDVILMDVSMPVADGVSTTRALLARRPELGVIFLTMHAEEKVVFKAIEAGARGYLLKNARINEVAHAIRVVSSGASLIDATLATRVLQEFRRLSTQSGKPETPAGLSETEVKMLRLVASGLSNKEIARRMCFAEATVKNRLSVIFDKLQVEDRTQAAIYALTHGIGPCGEDELREDRSGALA